MINELKTSKFRNKEDYVTEEDLILISNSLVEFLEIISVNAITRADEILGVKKVLKKIDVLKEKYNLTRELDNG